MIATPARKLSRLLQPCLHLFQMMVQFLMRMKIDRVVRLACRRLWFQISSAEEQELHVRLERVDRDDPTLATQSVERNVPLHHAHGVRHRVENELVNLARNRLQLWLDVIDPSLDSLSTAGARDAARPAKRATR